MSDPPPLSGPILSCPTGESRPSRRFAALTGALLLHLFLLALPLLVPLMIVEMIRAPEATVPPLIFYPPRPSVGSPSNTPGQVRKGGGPAKPSRASAPTRVVPLEQPSPNAEPADITASALPVDVPDGTPGLPPGPGLPDGVGGDLQGTRDGHPGSKGGGPMPPGPDPREGRIYEWTADVIAPVLIRETRRLPKYPRVARRAGMDGSVVLIAAVRPDGTIGEIEVLRAPDPRFGFEFAAIEAVKQWRYRPGLMHGRPVTVYVRVIVEFTLSR